nr:hypothetical protein [Tanacetum cinerariifolium]
MIARRVTDDLIIFSGDTAPRRLETDMMVQSWKWVNLIYIYILSLKVLTMVALYILDKLAEFSDSSRLQDKMKALGQQGEALKPLDYMKEIVGRDSTTLGVLEQLLVGTHAGMRLKASYVAGWKNKSRVSWVSITKNQTLIARLEALGQHGEALKPLDYMKKMVGRDSATL